MLSGLLLTLVGIGCGAVALRRTWTEHGSGSLLPDSEIAVQRARALVGRVLPRLRKRQVVSADNALVLLGEIAVRGSLTLRVLPREGATADELIAHLLKRVERVEVIADEDRAAASADTSKVRAELTSVSKRADEEALRLEALTKSVAVGTVRLQLVGLILIGFGTALMSVPSLTG